MSRIQHYSKNESIDRIYRLLRGDTFYSDIPETLPPPLYSIDESLSRLAELLAGSLPGEVATLPSGFSSLTRSATINVAANNASSLSKLRSDYVCDGLNDEVQIQAAIDALPAAGGRVQLSEGTFTVANAGSITADVVTVGYCVKILETHPPVSISGIPGATIIKLADSQAANSVQLLLHGLSTARRTNATTIQGIEFDGNNANQADAWTDFGDIAIMYADQVTVQNCRFHDWKRSGIHAFRTAQKLWILDNYFYDEDGMGAARLENAYYIIRGNIFEAAAGLSSGATLQLPPDADVSATTHCHVVMGNVFVGGFNQINAQGLQAAIIIGNVFSGITDANGRALIIQHASSTPAYNATNNVVIGNTFYNIANAIRLNSSASNGSLNNIVALNNILDGPDVNLTYGIQEDGATGDNNMILFNFIDSASSTEVAKAGASTVVQGNKNYITENKGAAAAVADGGTIAHGCAAAPSVVTVSGSIAGEFVSVTAIDATNITVAIKKHDNSAGTAQTVYWRAYV